MEEQLNADMIKNVKNKLHVWGREKDGYEKNDGKKKKRRLKVHMKQYIYIYIYLYVKHGGGGGGENGFKVRERYYI